ncbi:ERV/ALR sulfhydryl oxidase domain-containing protein, partial [Naematelia encephala]
MLRLPRLVLSIFLVILFTSLYIFYPSSERTPRAGEVEYSSYEAGGIDSDHYRRPIKPDFDFDREEQGRAWEEDDQEVSSKSGASEDIFMGGVIMPKLGNETAKAELGRAAWRVLHLMTLRYPDNPSPDDRLALKSYMHLFSRLYPCGECATEFQKLLKEYPPQTSSRKSASLWLCHLHNLVNIRLDKPEFDCLTLDETYDCGCGPESSASSTLDVEGAKETGSS